MSDYYDEDKEQLKSYERKIRSKQSSEGPTYKQRRMRVLFVILAMLAVSCGLHFTEPGQKLLHHESPVSAPSTTETEPSTTQRTRKPNPTPSSTPTVQSWDELLKEY